MEQTCLLADKWGIEDRLAEGIIQAQGLLPFDIWIFSGSRSRSQQADLEERGRPTAPFAASTHADVDRGGCPRLATGADVQPVSPAIRADLSQQALFGSEMTRAGLRWGGRPPPHPFPGIPVDKWHVDLGPRTN